MTITAEERELRKAEAADLFKSRVATACAGRAEAQLAASLVFAEANMAALKEYRETMHAIENTPAAWSGPAPARMEGPLPTWVDERTPAIQQGSPEWHGPWPKGQTSQPPAPPGGVISQ